MRKSLQCCLHFCDSAFSIEIIEIVSDFLTHESILLAILQDFHQISFHLLSNSKHM